MTLHHKKPGGATLVAQSLQQCAAKAAPPSMLNTIR